MWVALSRGTAAAVVSGLVLYGFVGRLLLFLGLWPLAALPPLVLGCIVFEGTRCSEKR